MEIYIAILLTTCVLYLLYKHFNAPSITTDSKRQELEDLQLKSSAEISSLKSDNSLLIGENTQLKKQFQDLKERLIVLDERLSFLTKENSDFKSLIQLKEREISVKMNELVESRKSFEDEKLRIRREDDERIRLEIENRDKVWSVFEDYAIDVMSQICQSPRYSFKYFTNSNLPKHFDGSFEPDFLLEFLGQYVIFDAKSSKSKDIKVYIKDQVKKTVAKIKASPTPEEIFTNVYFVIPSMAISEVPDRVIYDESGYTFFVIPLEAVEPLIASFKRITFYELAEKFDPRDRESIVNLMASYDIHVRRQNAINLVATYSGLEVLSRKKSLSKDFLKDLEHKVSEHKFDGITQNEVKKFAQNPTNQLEVIRELVSPSTPIVDEKLITEANSLF